VKVKQTGSKLEMLFVDKREGEINRNVLYKARKQWSESKKTFF